MSAASSEAVAVGIREEKWDKQTIKGLNLIRLRLIVNEIKSILFS